LYRPLRSLREGHWFKLICGASFQHLPSVRSLALAYALAGADCIDVAADPAVIATVQDALRVVADFNRADRTKRYREADLPWLMVSLNDGEDPHFRKAEFNPEQCPADCLRPCEAICPVQAIVFDRPDGFSGVVDELCYGCGRCLTICPPQQITTRSYVSTASSVLPLVLAGVDALEIHTQVDHFADFKRLWQAIAPYVAQLKLIAISCPDGEDLIDYLWALYDLMRPLPCELIWQTDGRPMSGDIGVGATRAAVKLGQKVLAAGLPGYVQLAGGTNHHTVAKLKELGLLKSSAATPYIAGVAYGSYARSVVLPILEGLEAQATLVAQGAGTERVLPSPPVPSTSLRLEENPNLLWQAVDRAHVLVSELKLSAKFNSALVRSLE
jgi:Fe-S-cluster-containing hydrogenase component 2